MSRQLFRYTRLSFFIGIRTCSSSTFHSWLSETFKYSSSTMFLRGSIELIRFLLMSRNVRPTRLRKPSALHIWVLLITTILKFWKSSLIPLTSGVLTISSTRRLSNFPFSNSCMSWRFSHLMNFATSILFALFNPFKFNNLLHFRNWTNFVLASSYSNFY